MSKMKPTTQLKLNQYVTTMTAVTCKLIEHSFYSVVNLDGDSKTDMNKLNALIFDASRITSAILANSVEAWVLDGGSED